MSLTSACVRVAIATLSRQPHVHVQYRTSSISTAPNLFIASIEARSGDVKVRYVDCHHVLIHYFGLTCKLLQSHHSVAPPITSSTSTTNPSNIPSAQIYIPNEAIREEEGKKGTGTSPLQILYILTCFLCDFTGLRGSIGHTSHIDTSTYLMVRRSNIQYKRIEDVMWRQEDGKILLSFANSSIEWINSSINLLRRRSQ